eukprot:Seg1445.7 transcript_id=Seg1445.7/GoldUCD/mRNA.D3Y31 product="Condensin-2 complex subunit H2" protein_id=Seg1445.7/GoldUCD/D3Y31
MRSKSAPNFCCGCSRAVWPKSANMREEGVERLSWLLKPIRDLNENWNIQLAEELEKYHEEIEGVQISFDGGKTTLNFAEAAMLIQGSACVYSKKVEYLYSLTHSTLQIVHSNKQAMQQAPSVDDQGTDSDTTFNQHADQDKLLDLDDIEESDNIELKNDTEEHLSSEGARIIPRIPFALMPKSKMDKRGEDVLLNQKGEVIGNRNDFKMNTCILHSSGALLMDINSVPLLEKSIANRTGSTPKPPNREAMADKDINAEMEVDAGNASFDDPGIGGLSYDDDDDNQPNAPSFNDIPNAPSSPINSHHENEGPNLRLREYQRRAQEIENAGKQANWEDPWEELDLYEGKTHLEKPFKKGRPFKIPQSLKELLTKQKGRKRKNRPIRFGLSIPVCPIVEFCGNSLINKSQGEKMKSTRFPEFEYLFRIEKDKRREVKKKERRIVASRFTQEQIADIESIVEPCQDDDDDDDYDDCGPDFGNDDGIGTQENRVPGPGSQDVPFDANPLEDIGPSSYEDLVRQYIGNYIEEAENYAQQTELTKRVKEWQERIGPVLEEEENHRPFDIHEYGSEILESFQDSTDSTFHNIVKDKERHEVCRYFLSTLLLANMNNVEIKQPKEQLSMDDIHLKLLDKTPAHQAISDYRAPSVQD